MLNRYYFFKVRHSLWRRIGIVLLIVLPLLYCSSSPWFLTLLGQPLVIDTFETKAKIAVVLSGEFPDRVREAAALYNEGRVTEIVLNRLHESESFVSLRREGVHIASMAERSYNLLRELGVPEMAITTFQEPVQSTRQEARLLQRYLSRLQFNSQRSQEVASVVIVTSPYHTARARFIFRQIMDDSTELFIRPSRFGSFRATDWWRSRLHIRQLVIEYQKFVVAALGL